MTVAHAEIHTDPATLPAPVADLLAEGSLYAGLTFWQAMDRAHAAIVSAGDGASAVVAILKANPHTERELGQTFGPRFSFWHTGGDRRLASALRDNGGWTVLWGHALHYVARHRDGSILTYCEGDVAVGIAWGAPADLADGEE